MRFFFPFLSLSSVPSLLLPFRQVWLVCFAEKADNRSIVFFAIASLAGSRSTRPLPTSVDLRTAWEQVTRDTARTPLLKEEGLRAGSSLRLSLRGVWRGTSE